MNKLLSGIVGCCLLSSFAMADESLADVTVKGGVTNIYVEEITGAKLETTPIPWMDVKAEFHILGFSPTVGYSRTFVANNESQAGSKTFRAG
jgi:hypothetical protein